MTTRRNLLIGAVSLAVIGSARAEPMLTDAGLYKEPWFLESFLELADDLEAAHKQGKRFVIMWELKGCPYCKAVSYTHLRAHETRHDLVCRLLLEKKKKDTYENRDQIIS